ncbi:hypothetical protein SDC9_07433 [bioreactor metagenome]|uniref:Uncharacterized protein n=1 Tax=bioreactor metagenome TaxID=1076179 RepID=A0A644T4V3_9ZZZZ|nr:hypothetical protein [Methanobrevibacter sp.]MEA4956890.1 hypothetical protein [Methanobrevibacter sp.]
MSKFNLLKCMIKGSNKLFKNGEIHLANCPNCENKIYSPVESEIKEEEYILIKCDNCKTWIKIF